MTTPRTARAWPILLAALAFCPAALGQDAVLEFKQVLQARPAIDPMLPGDQQAQALRRFYEERERNLAELLGTRFTTLTELHQLLILKEWCDSPLADRVDADVVVSDLRVRSAVAERLRAGVRAIAERGDDDNRAAVAAFVLDLGVTVRAAPNPANAYTSEGLAAELRAGFARSLTDEIIRLIAADSERVRLQALRALGGINAEPKRAAATFAAQLAPANAVKVRRAAAEGLLRLMITAADLKDHALQSPAAWATDLDVLGVAVEVVRHAPGGLGDVDALVRTRCAEALRGGAQVLAVLFQKPPAEVARLAPPPRAYPLAEIEAIKDLLRAFHDAGPRIAKSLRDAEISVRLALVETLDRLSDARCRLAEEPLTIDEAGKVQGKVSLVPPQASDPLANFAVDHWRAAARLLADPDVRVRRATVHFLEFFPEARPAVVPELAKALWDADRFVRWAAARALGHFTDRYQPPDAVAVVPALARRLFDPEVSVRLAAAATLEAFGPCAEAAVPELTRAVQSGDVENRLAALCVLQRIDPGRATPAIPTVTGALDHADPRVRRAAAETLARYGPLARNPATLDALRRALNDPDQAVRLHAGEALRQVLVIVPSGSQ